MAFIPIKTLFNSTIEGGNDGHFARKVNGMVVSYVAYFVAEGKKYKLEILTGEQGTANEINELEDIEAYLTSPDNSKLNESLNSALYVLREFQQQYEKKIGKGTTVRFVSWDRKLDEQVNSFIDSREFRATMEPKGMTLGGNTISRLLGEKKASDEEISRPIKSKYSTNPVAFDYGDHIQHFEDTAKGLLGNGSVVNLALGRLNDDGGDYDTIILSGDKTGVDVLHGPTRPGTFDIVRTLVNMGRII